jgi:lysophospholipid acyltransferase (LPLAT)-like uncharacterized protein
VNLKKTTRPLLLKLAPYLILLISRILDITCKIISIKGAENIHQLLQKQQPFLPCYWHQQSVFCALYLLKLQAQGLKLAFLASPSRDGEIGVKVFNTLGAQVIRGSSSKSGAKALRGVYLAIKKENISVATTSDGPRGPAFEFKPGWLMLAQLCTVPIIPIAYAADKSWQFNSWDHFFLPKPFSKISIVIGEPVYVAKKLNEEELTALQNKLTKTLKELSLDATKVFN